MKVMKNTEGEDRDRDQELISEERDHTQPVQASGPSTTNAFTDPQLSRPAPTPIQQEAPGNSSTSTSHHLLYNEAVHYSNHPSYPSYEYYSPQSEGEIPKTDIINMEQTWVGAFP